MSKNARFGPGKRREVRGRRAIWTRFLPGFSGLFFVSFVRFVVKKLCKRSGGCDGATLNVGAARRGRPTRAATWGCPYDLPKNRGGRTAHRPRGLNAYEAVRTAVEQRLAEKRPIIMGADSCKVWICQEL